ncbi:hypothetical protein HanOQP8_Chr08g0279891 [Helianthus annuus]|nr:hypothetical protein HanLR1_Chr08g0272311 [Helianthus annuus]KAJ0721832.1 hypothetical protein HanOQP8_Chr08g0279891 [Helianthus annuus]
MKLIRWWRCARSDRAGGTISILTIRVSSTIGVISCAQAWNTKAWLSKSKCGSSNRNNADINDRSSRHTGGSMGFDEHRENWRRTYGREPTWKELFLQTHLTKECKEKLRKGEISIYDMKNLKFCTNQSKEVYGGYLEAMHDIHGSDLTDCPDDPEVWARVQAGGHRTTRVFGVGSSDLHYMVSGTSSSSSGCAPSSSVEYQRSIEEAQAMRTQLAKLEARLEVETKEREDLRVHLESESKAREDLQQHMERELQNFMKNWHPPNN